MNWRSKIVRRPLAERDIENQVDYYLFDQDSPTTAVRFADAVERTLESIVTRPWVSYGRCHGRLEGYYRRAVDGFPNHLLFFIPNEDGISLVRLLHGASDLATYLDTPFEARER